MYLYTSEKEEPGFLIRVCLIVGICLLFTACAGKPEKNFSYAPTSNATDEIQNLKTEMKRTESEQIAFFAPESYQRANKSLMKAESLQQNGESNTEVLEELGLARGFFEQAKSVADRSLQSMPQIAEAREKALMAGAIRYHRPEMEEVDKDLVKITKAFESKSPDVSLIDRTRLQSAYSNLELQSIKASRLGNSLANIEGAKKMGAEKYAPRTLDGARNKLHQAELTINADRHNDALISEAQDAAFQESQKLVKVTELSRQTGRTGNEAMALDIFNRDQKISQLSSEVDSTQSQLSSVQMSANAAERELASRRQSEQALSALKSQFTPQEAEVMRQGEHIVIRLKGLTFATGKTEIPSSSFSLLNKVKESLRMVNASKVVVEGHADSVGPVQINQKLSQARAFSVAQFLDDQVPMRATGGVGTDGALNAEASQPQIEAVGYGFEHPLTSNKTKEGRAQNRRVDIVITPVSQKF